MTQHLFGEGRVVWSSKLTALHQSDSSYKPRKHIASCHSMAKPYSGSGDESRQVRRCWCGFFIIRVPDFCVIKTNWLDHRIPCHFILGNFKVYYKPSRYRSKNQKLNLYNRVCTVVETYHTIWSFSMPNVF